jgi:hypothetical protein
MIIKHLIITRFLNDSKMRLGNSLLNPEVINYRMQLMIKYLYTSLNNQSNLNFTHVILIHDELPDEYIKKLYNIPTKFDKIIIKKNELSNIIKPLYDECDFLITSRIDDDDMIYFNAVDDVQKIINENTTIKIYGYQNGCTMIDGSNELYSFKKTTNSGMIAILLSLIINTKKVNPLTIYGLGNHTKIKNKILENYSKFGIDKLPTDFWHPNLTINPAWIYVRHKKSDSGGGHRTKIKMNVDVKKIFGFE